MSEKLTQAIDEITTAVKVTCENATLMYFYEINDDADSYCSNLADADKEVLKKEIELSHKAHFCVRMNPLHDDIAGAVLDYKLKSNGADFLRNEMKMSDCDK